MTQIPKTMSGVVLTGHGGLDKLEYRTDLPVPTPGADDVLIKVEAAGVNNTDINTRIGWYSKSVKGDTGGGAADGFAASVDDDGSWSGKPLTFPRIQGADCYGEIVAVGGNVSKRRIGEKVLVRTMMRAPVDFRPFETETYGSEHDGGFAEYALAPDGDTFAVNAELSPVELGAIPCAFSTAEGMLVRAGITGEDTVLITGASGGVGAAAVQLAKLRGATVIAVAGAAKVDAVRQLGADRVIPRGTDLVAELGRHAVSAVVDLVGGAGFPDLPEILMRGGRYVTAGAIAGPIVELDLRTLYLNDLTLYGSTVQENAVFENVIRYLEEGRLKPRIAATFPLSEIRKAQEKFLSKDFVGKLVLIP